MFRIELYGMGVYGTAKGPERVSFGGDNIDDAISQAELLIQENTFHFGKASWFRIYDDNDRLVYDSKAP
jgi:hypothetical protein